MVIPTPWSSNNAPANRSSFGFPTSSGTGTVFGVTNTPGIDFNSTPGFGVSPSNSATASTNASIFGVAFPSTTLGSCIKSNSANASTSSVFGEPNSSPFFATGSTTSTSYAFPSTTLGSGIKSNSANASTSSVFGAPNSSPFFTTGSTTSTPYTFPSTTPGFGIKSNSANASTNSVFGAPSSSAFFTTGSTTSTSYAFPSTTPGSGIKSNSANASTNSVFGAPSSSPFFTTGSTSTSCAFPSTTSWFDINSTNTSGFRLNSTSMSGSNNIFGIKSLTESQGTTKLKPTTGSRLSPYSVVEVKDKKCTEKFQSISAMPVYEAKSHEELRLEDYELLPTKGDGFKTCDIQRPPFQPVKPNNNLFVVSNNTTSSTYSTFFPSPSPFSANSTSEPVKPNNNNMFPHTNNNTTTIFRNPFSHSNNNTTTLFPNPSSLSSPSPSQPQPSNAKPNPFSITNSNPSPSQTQPFNAMPKPFSLPDPNPSLSQPRPFNTALTNSKLTSIVSPSTQSTTSVSALGPWSSIFNTSQPAGITGSVFINNPSQPSQISSGLKVENKVGYPCNNGQQQQHAPPSTVVAQSSLAADPFPNRSEIERPDTVLTSVQHGISSLPEVPNKLSSNRSTSLLRIRHVSSRLNSLTPNHRYTTPSSEPKVAFFHNEVDRPGPFLPRKNPRAWVTNSLPSLHYSTKGKCFEDKDLPNSSFQLSTYVQEATEHISATSISCQNDDDVSVVTAKKHEANVLSLMPKLPNGNGYYTEPSLNELAANEMDEPGSSSRVNDFVVGRSGYGSIKFLGETDVRHLDLGSVVQFNNREVIVYADEKTKPDVGKGMNKPAEVTLLNVKCVSKKTGKQYVDGPQVQGYKEMLMNKASEQGAEFVSYDPVRAEWKFRVLHF